MVNMDAKTRGEHRRARRANTVPGTGKLTVCDAQNTGRKKNINIEFGVGVYMNVSLKETDCLQKSFHGIFFPSTFIKCLFCVYKHICFVYSRNQGNIAALP